ncbi:hypothetical protein [Marinoscillum sp.]|uniref:hypothetical protein n=1 Tax=Marinoscillum sp. TaxID=2024838 RepID=UPI003BABF8D7
MKTKIFISVLALVLFACGGETKSADESAADVVDEATDAVSDSMDSVVSEMDTAMTATSDSLEMAIDSVTSEAP